MSFHSSILQDKLVVVTGAGSGIGQAIAIGMAAEGAEVILVGRRVVKLDETLALIVDNGAKAFPITADVGKVEDVEALAAKVFHDFGVPSVVVNAAGIHGEIKPILGSNPKRWIDTLTINTVGPYLVCRAFAGEMVKQGWGRIVNLTSAASLSQPSGINSAYATSKVALNHFTRQLASELAGTGVTANVIHPGEVQTEMWAAIRDDSADTGAMKRWVEWVEQTGGDTPEKTVHLILDLLKPEHDNTNGRFLWIEEGLKKPLPAWD